MHDLDGFFLFLICFLGGYIVQSQAELKATAWVPLKTSRSKEGKEPPGPLMGCGLCSSRCLALTGGLVVQVGRSGDLTVIARLAHLSGRSSPPKAVASPSSPKRVRPMQCGCGTPSCLDLPLTFPVHVGGGMGRSASGSLFSREDKCQN